MSEVRDVPITNNRGVYYYFRSVKQPHRLMKTISIRGQNLAIIEKRDYREIGTINKPTKIAFVYYIFWVILAALIILG